MHYNIPTALEEKFQAYRELRKIERDGKVLQKVTAITELLGTGLDAAPAITERTTFAELIRRVEKLEAKIGGD